MLDLGHVSHGEEVGRSVWVKNLGDCPWVLKHFETGCGCVTLQYDEKPLAPNDSVPIWVLFNSKGFNGRQIKMVTLYDNSEKGFHEVIVMAHVE